MSTHKVEVVRLRNVVPHPNADTLSIARVYGYTVAFRSQDYREGDLAVFIEPDYVVPDTADFAFLKDKRVRALKLRGLWSQGLLMPAPAGAAEGDDVMAAWGIMRYEPVVREDTDNTAGSEAGPDDLRWMPRYSLENLRRHPMFEHGEPVYMTEKVDGSQSRFAFRNGRMYSGSMNEWVKPHPNSMWSRAIDLYPWIQEFCEANQDSVLFGEIIGGRPLKYGFNRGTPGFLAFDILKGTQFLNPVDFECALDSRYRVPGWFGSFDAEKIAEFALSDSWVCPGQMAEGLVIKPLQERSALGIGRVIAKHVSDRYLAKS